jgi:hypothetical protein
LQDYAWHREENPLKFCYHYFNSVIHHFAIAFDI